MPLATQRAPSHGLRLRSIRRAHVAETDGHKILGDVIRGANFKDWINETWSMEPVAGGQAAPE
jgi:hypothetical protein